MRKYGKMKWLLLFLIAILVLSPVSVQAASKVALNKKNAVLLKNKVYQLKLKNTKKKVKWSSSNKNVVTVSSKGKIKAKKPGTATITAKAGTKKYKCKVTVPNKAIKLCKGGTESLKAPGLKGKIQWSSSQKSMVSVSSKGKIKAKKAGRSIITAKAGKKVYRTYVIGVNKKHSWKKKSTRKPTCIKAGKITYACRNCSSVYGEILEPVGHSYQKKVVKPTCEGKGYTIYTCKRDKSHTKMTSFVKAAGHKYGKWTVEEKATCLKTGWQTAVCSVCGNKGGKEVPMIAHKYVNGRCQYCHASQKRSTANKMTVQVTKDKINIHIDGVGKASDGTLRLIRMAPYEYAEGDQLNGISKNTKSLGTEIALYACQTDTTITTDRYDEQGNDRLYYKYYLISKKGLVKGPIYPSDITPERSVEKFSADTKKGLLGESLEMAKDTGSKYTAFNLDLPHLFIAGEDQEGNPIDNIKRGAYSWDFQGKTYFFNKGYVDSIDSQVKEYTKADIGVTLILIAWNSSQWNWKADYPTALLYEGGSDKGTIVGVNTSNEEGAKYWMAAVEFLAERYSRADKKYGRINNVVVGNEIDYAYDYNNIGPKATSLDVYMEEYSRLLRLTHMAISKYMDCVTVTVPTTHDWMRAEYYNCYKPKEIYDWLNEKTKAEGDYNWGLSPHCYPFSLANSFGIEDDTINGRKMYGMSGDYKTSSFLSFSNLEILQEYLEQDQMKYNGELRDVYLTESGCSSYLCREGDLRRQAAYTAAAYYKAAVLDCVDAFIYYRAYDHENEVAAGMTTGLVDSDGSKKYVYDVWKYIDTQYSYKVANEYLSAAGFYDKGVLSVPGVNSNDMDPKETAKYYHSVANGKIKTYKDLMYAFSEDFDWDTAWNEEKIIRRTIAPIPEWEDKADLGNVKFYGKSFLEDGEEHELLISGTLPEGITVEYENNKRTEAGSQEATARFYQNGELVATRSAQLHIGNMITNRSAYEQGEKIFVTVKAESTAQWVGIYKKGDTVGDVKDGGVPSVYWYYVNDGEQISGNTYSIQDIGKYNSDRPELKNLPAGEYEVILMGKDGTYSVDEKISITILASDKSSGLPRIDDIRFEDTVVTAAGAEQSLEIEGSLPDGVTVDYTNNKLTEPGSVQATAHFIWEGQELESRTATFTVEGKTDISLKTDKTTYQYGEDILVTATGTKNDWVAIYKKDDIIGAVKDGGIESIYWYYVCKEGNVSGQPFNIRKGTQNSSRTDWEEINDLPAGEYKIVFLENDTYNVLDQVNISIEGDRPIVTEKTLSTDKTTYTAGEAIQVTAEGDQSDWVAIYKKDDIIGAVEDGGIESIYWYYVCKEGNVSGQPVNIRKGTANTTRTDWDAVKDLPAGEYKIVLLDNGGYDVLKQVNISIEEKEPDPQEKALSTDKLTYTVGESIQVTATGDNKDWVAIYKAEDTIGSSVPSIYWYYVCQSGHASGDTVDIKGESANSSRTDWEEVKNLPAGDYKIVLLENDTYTVLKQIDITVEEAAAAKLKTDKTVYKMGEEIKVTAFSDTTKGAWVGLYRKDDKIGASQDGGVESIYWYYVNDEKHTSGQVYTIKDMDDSNCQYGQSRAALRYLPAGEYKLVLTPEDGSYAVAEQVNITIEPSETIEAGMQLLKPNAAYTPGEEIRIGTKPYSNTGQDWIAIFKEGVDYTKKDAVYLAYSAYITGDGTTTMTAPNEPGKYTLVFFGENTRYIVTTREIVVSDN